jgi:hypothetical protein
MKEVLYLTLQNYGLVLDGVNDQTTINQYLKWQRK